MRNLQKVLHEEGLRGLYRGKKKKENPEFEYGLIVKAYDVPVGSNYFHRITINMGSNIKHNRVFSISILHSPVSHHLFSLVRKMQALLQGKIRLER